MLELTIGGDVSQKLTFEVRKLVNAGRSSRDIASMRKHMEELRKTGITIPDEFPVFYPKTSERVTTATRFGVLPDSKTSGEVEFVLLLDNGNIYVTGRTASLDFPTTSGSYDENHNGAQDAFIVKLNISQNLLEYATLVGGSEYDNVISIVVDGDNCAYISGNTGSSDYPTTSGAFQTINPGLFLTKINEDGSTLVYSTFLGGQDEERLGGIAIDIDKNVYLTGSTKSNDFPVTNNAYNSTYNGSGDVFFSKININSNILEYSTYIGGSSGDNGIKVAIYENSNIYIETSLNTNVPAVLPGFVKEFGFEKILFGTNYPYSSYRLETEKLLLCHFSENDNKKIFYGNAKKLLNMES